MKIVMALSGGLDSGVLLDRFLGEGHHVRCVSFVYGSKHNYHERAAALSLHDHFNRTHQSQLGGMKLIDVAPVFAGNGSALMATGPDLPHGHYEAETMRQTVVPGRNLVFASILASYAEAGGCDTVALGVHAGDHFIYPDCRPQFIYQVNATVRASSDDRVGVFAPFLHLTKKEIVSFGLKSGFPFHLTRTCYTDKPVACGKCGSCQERLQAFKDNGVEDPLQYESRDILPFG